MFDIIRNKRKQILVSDHAPQGSTVLAGPFPSPEDAKRTADFTANQRKFLMGDGEEIRIHADNGGYLFSVRLDVNSGPVIVHDVKFSQQRDEYQVPVNLYPWMKK